MKQPMKYAYTLDIACAMTAYSGGSFRATPINQTKAAPTAGSSTPTKNCQFMLASFFEKKNCRTGNFKGQVTGLRRDSMSIATTPAQPAPLPVLPAKQSDKVQIGPLDV